MIKTELKKKINEVEKEIIKTEVNMVTAEYIHHLLLTHDELLDLLYFKVNQEKDWLKKTKK